MKSSIYLLSCLFILLVFNSCQHNGDKAEHHDDHKDCHSIGNAKEVEGLISKEEGQEMLDRYIKNQYAAINEKMGKEDNLDIYFSLEKIKNYIAYLEEQSKTAENPITGVRVYFGAKEENGKVGSTVFFIPTYELNDNQSKAAVISTQGVGVSIENSTAAQGLDYGQAGDPPRPKI